ncbi:MAG TPA: putative glycolipid-binding domain-containing protein [Streptosporangiaceae bacterium]|nr:putative glycolipid-binding domain-containing protein [Streptosporangiaceae bacterium]
MSTDLIWEALEWPGLEHVVVSAGPAGFRADGQLVLGPPVGPASVSYQLSCDASWRVTGLTISAGSSAGRRTLTLSAGHHGHWLADGQRRPDLDGCIDVDISLTPLTNTLPIRRLTWAPESTHDLDVVYVSAPDFTVRRVSQRYTLLGAGAKDGAAVYRYESGSFKADLTVDGDGFVSDYPDCWRRVWPPEEAGA